MATGAQAGSRLDVVREVWARRELRRLTLAYVGYNLTEFASWIVILVYAFERGGVVESGVVATALLIPSAAIVPFAAGLGDRRSRALLLAAGQASMAGFAAASALALATDAPSPVVYLAMFGLTVGISVSRPLQVGVLASLADRAETLTAANVVNGLVESSAYFLGPLLAAALLPAAGAASVFGVMAGVMAASTVCVLGVAPTSPEPPLARDVPARRLGTELREALDGVLREPGTGWLIGLLSGREIVIGAMDVLFVAIAFQLLGTGDAGAALLNAAFGLGLVTGAFVSLSLVGARRITAAVVTGTLVAAASLLLLSRVSGEAAALWLLGGVGVGSLFSELAARMLLQRVTPPRRLARTFGLLESLGLLAAAIGMLGIAGLVSWLGIDLSLAILGGASVVAALAVAVPLARLERAYGPPPADRLKALRALPIFRSLGALALEHLARSARRIRFAPGEILIRQGEPGGPFFVLLEGTVEVRVDSARVRTHGPGESFGEIASLQASARTAQVRALEPVEALAIDGEAFLEAISSSAASLASARRVAEARLERARPAPGPAEGRRGGSESPPGSAC